MGDQKPHEPHWIDWGAVADNTNISAYECSECNATFYSNEIGNRCPNCKTIISKVIPHWKDGDGE